MKLKPKTKFMLVRFLILFGVCWGGAIFIWYITKQATFSIGPTFPIGPAGRHFLAIVLAILVLFPVYLMIFLAWVLMKARKLRQNNQQSSSEGE